MLGGMLAHTDLEAAAVAVDSRPEGSGRLVVTCVAHGGKGPTQRVAQARGESPQIARR
mgnify:CR=1 FL=1